MLTAVSLGEFLVVMHSGVVPLLYGSMLLMVGVTQGQGRMAGHGSFSRLHLYM